MMTFSFFSIYIFLELEFAEINGRNFTIGSGEKKAVKKCQSENLPERR